MSKHVDSDSNCLSLWEAHQQSLGATRNTESPATRRTQPRHRLRGRKGRGSLVQLASSFDRDLVNVDVKCDLLRGALTQEDLLAVERAGYTLASAYLVAEATVMRMHSASPSIPESIRIARRALLATSCVVTALFGEALAETSKWAGRDPKRPGLRRLRAVLSQLSLRVDVRGIDTIGKHCGVALAESSSGARRIHTL